MCCRNWRACLRWGASCAALIGVGVALYATLPPSPRFALRADMPDGITPLTISADGSVVVARRYKCDADEVVTELGPFKSWHTFTGEERGEYFVGLTGAFGARGRDDLDARGFDGADFTNFVVSPDRGYCAFVHRDGLALVDWRTGRQWPRVVAWSFPEYASAEALAVYRLLQRPYQPEAGEAKLKDALQELSDGLGGKLKIVMDRKALAEGGIAVDDIDTRLPNISSPLAVVVLRLALANADSNLDYLIRGDHVEITTRKRTSERRFWPPVFSPRGSYVAFVEGGREHGKLHVIECAAGRLVATLAVDATACEDVGFTPDDAFLCFFAPGRSEPTFTVWDLKGERAARTFDGIKSHSIRAFAPDGENVLVGDELLNVRTGSRRPMPSADFSYGDTFSPDGRTLVREGREKLLVCDVATGKLRGEIEHGWLRTPLMISADSQVLVCGPTYRKQEFTAWSLGNYKRLWPPPEPQPPAQEGNGGVVQEVFEGGGLMGPAEMSPRFTPDNRFLVKREEHRIEMLDPATGAVQASLDMGTHAKDPAILAFTPDGRWTLSQWDFAEREPWPGEEWLGKWLPLRKAAGCLVVSETQSGRIRLRVDFPGRTAPTAVLSDDGRTLMTGMWRGDSGELACWDVPGRPSLWPVVGIPLGLGSVALLLRWWMKRRMPTRLALPSPPAAESHSGSAMPV